MAYILGQYNEQTRVDGDSTFMSLVTSGTARRRSTSSDSGVSGSSDLVFNNECVQINSTLSSNNHYYFHGKIKRMLSDQEFEIKLVNFDDSSLDQFIKNVTVTGGNENEWVDIEFTFTPFVTFDTILFYLKRTAEDSLTGARIPIIIYEELSIINNVIPKKIRPDTALIKIGVQGRPGALMCINGEEIRICRTGIYEIKNGVILVDFFSVVNAADETNPTLIGDQITEINTRWNNATTQEQKEAIGSRCLFSYNKVRTINGFTLDYLYREE